MLSIHYLIDLAIDARAFYSYSHWLVHAIDRTLIRPSYKQLAQYLLSHVKSEGIVLDHVRPLLSINTGDNVHSIAHIEEDTLYLLLVLRLGQVIEINRRSVLEKRVFFYRMDFKRPNLFIDFTRYPGLDFESKVESMKKDYSEMKAEVIEDSMITDELFDILYDMEGINKEHVKDLELLYLHWNQSFPTESVATRILEEVYMTKLDNDMVEKKIEFARRGKIIWYKA